MNVDALESAVGSSMDVDSVSCPGCGSDDCVRMTDDEATCLDCGSDFEY